jgi:hypothetical protein
LPAEGPRVNAKPFDHFGTYNVFSGAMDRYLLSLADQEVFIGALKSASPSRLASRCTRALARREDANGLS